MFVERINQSINRHYERIKEVLDIVPDQGKFQI
jgi:hypothetical protein